MKPIFLNFLFSSQSQSQKLLDATENRKPREIKKNTRGNSEQKLKNFVIIVYSQTV